MFDAVLGILFCFFILTLIGLGPSVLIFKKNINSIAAAPTLGFIITTLISISFILLNYPIHQWALYWAIIGIIISLAITGFSLNKAQPDAPFNKNHLIVFIVGLAITCILTLAPFLIGELNFTVFRGNGGDMLNYIAMAGYLQHEPYSWLTTATSTDLLTKHPSYPIAQQVILYSRWAVSAMLGWCSSISHIPLYRLEYLFSVMPFIMAYCCAFGIAIELNIKSLYALLTALAISLGFWAQLVLDLRAFSQISVIPVTLFLALLVTRIEKPNPHYLLQLFLGLTLTAFFSLYCEQTPFIILAFLLYFGFELFSKSQHVITLLKKYGFAFIIFGITSVIINADLILFFINQAKFALTSNVSWYQAYFNWLYKNPLFGPWGFSIFKHRHHPVFELGLTLLCSALTIISFVALYLTIRSYKNLSTLFRIIFAFSLATLIQFSLLLAHHQLWAAGKAASYGYAFVFLFVAAFAFTLLKKLHPPRKKILIGTQFVVVAWLVLQSSLGILRLPQAYHHSLYPHYTGTHSDYAKYDWNLKAFDQRIRELKPNHIGILIANDSINEYLGFCWGWETWMTSYAPLDHYEKPVDARINAISGKTALPEYIIVLTSHPNIHELNVIAKNNSFALIKTPENSLAQRKLLLSVTS